MELFFDLVVVIAIAAAAHGLVHEVGEGHIVMGVIKYLMAFFAIWWPWNLFTWFASSFDNDDGAYRLNVMVMMVGVMLIAASIPTIFTDASLTYGFVGYIILRFASALLWFRVGGGNPQLKRTAKRYAVAQIAIQGFWAIVVFAAPPGSVASIVLFAVGVVGELFIPWYAEQATNTPWHRHHIKLLYAFKYVEHLCWLFIKIHSDCDI